VVVNYARRPSLRTVAPFHVIRKEKVRKQRPVSLRDAAMCSVQLHDSLESAHPFHERVSESSVLFVGNVPRERERLLWRHVVALRNVDCVAKPEIEQPLDERTEPSPEPGLFRYGCTSSIPQI